MKIISKKHYKVGVGVIGVALVFSAAMWASYVHGEQAGGAPESGSTSYIKSLYTDLQTSGYGSDIAAPDWGAYWNRLKTAGTWTPSGTATAADVTTGKTFYGSDRTRQTGSLPVASKSGNCPTQAYDDSEGGSVTQVTNCTDTVQWIAPNDSIAGTDMKDPVSGLIWSTALNNTAGTLAFSAPTDNINGVSTWSWDASGANNIAVGNKTAITLCSSLGNGWRLPTQKEIMQAYIDGSFYNLSFSRSYIAFWSSTQLWEPYAWYGNLGDGRTIPIDKSMKYDVRCVR